MEVYNPKTDIWSVLPSMLTIGRSYTGVCVVDKP
jgi:kelch-like protein 2/3